MTRLEQIAARADKQLSLAAHKGRHTEFPCADCIAYMDSVKGWMKSSRDDVPWLLARVKELTAALKMTEYSGDFCDDPACPACLHRPWATKKHNKDCEVGNALKAVEE